MNINKLHDSEEFDNRDINEPYFTSYLEEDEDENTRIYSSIMLTPKDWKKINTELRNLSSKKFPMIKMILEDLRDSVGRADYY